MKNYKADPSTRRLRELIALVFFICFGFGIAALTSSPLIALISFCIFYALYLSKRDNPYA